MRKSFVVTVAALFAFLGSTAVAQPAPAFRVEVLDRNTDIATLRVPQCVVGTVMRFAQPVGLIEFGEVGAFVVVTGHTLAPGLNGLYRITRFSFRRDRDRSHIDSSFEAVCIVTPNPT